jgi:hypothetical protein
MRKDIAPLRYQATGLPEKAAGAPAAAPGDLAQYNLRDLLEETTALVNHQHSSDGNRPMTASTLITSEA